MKTKKEVIASALKTQEGKDRLGKAIVKGMFDEANKPGPYQILSQAILNHYGSDKAKKAFPWNKENSLEEPADQEEFNEEGLDLEPCVWHGFAEANEVTHTFPFGNEFNRYFQISCPDCGAKQVYQMTRNKLYVIRSEHHD